MQSRVVASRALLERRVQLLECACEGGAQSDLEQPTNAMSWLASFVQAFLLRVHALCVVTPACKWEMDIVKSWMFASSSPLLHALAGTPTARMRMNPLQVRETPLVALFLSNLQLTQPSWPQLTPPLWAGFYVRRNLAQSRCQSPRICLRSLSSRKLVLLRPRRMGGGSQACLIGASPLWHCGCQRRHAGPKT